MKRYSLLCMLGLHKWEYTMGVLMFYRMCQKCFKRQKRLAIVGKWEDND